MSWFSDLVDTGRSLFGGVSSFLGGSSILGDLVKTAILGFTLNRVQASINNDQQASTTDTTTTTVVDTGVRIQVQPSSDYKVPVLYGSATFGGAITDAWLTTDNKTMYYAITLCEKTGNLLSTSSASAFVFNDIYLNDSRVIFKTDGITVDYVIDREGNQDISARDIVKVYCYAGNSTTPVVPEYYTNGSLLPAYSIMPNWNTDHTMTDTVFAIVQVEYNRDKGVTGLPNMMFTITNSMSLPGDCLYDYMTNTRYGAGIPSAEIDA